MIKSMINFPTNLTILLEPTAECNLRCRHCYHAKTNYIPKKMTSETLVQLLQCVSEYYNDIKIIWHGGEPLLMGYDFFREAYDLFEKYSTTNHIRFKFGIQTNGTLLDDKFIKLFRSTNTHISLSFDGKYNSFLRQKTSDVERIINVLRDKESNFTCVSTISAANVGHMKEMYEYFKELYVSVKFNPIYPDGAATGNRDFLISKEEWTSSFIDLFEYWLYDPDCNINLISCADILRKYMREYCGCVGGACLFRYLAIDAFGDLYPCGRLVCKDFRLVNINFLKDIREAFLSERYKMLSDRSIERIDKCKNCEWFSRCHSGCNASANLGSGLETPAVFDCYFTKHIFERIHQLIPTLNMQKLNPYAHKIISN